MQIIKRNSFGKKQIAAFVGAATLGLGAIFGLLGAQAAANREMQDKINQNQTIIEDQNNKIKEQETQLEDFKNQLNQTESNQQKIEKLQKDLESLQAANGSLSTVVTFLETEIDRLETQGNIAAENQKQLQATLENFVNTMGQEIENLSQSILNNSGDIDKLEQSIIEKFNDLSAICEDLQNRLDNLPTNDSEELRNQLAQAETAINLITIKKAISSTFENRYSQLDYKDHINTTQDSTVLISKNGDYIEALANEINYKNDDILYHKDTQAGTEDIQTNPSTFQNRLLSLLAENEDKFTITKEENSSFMLKKDDSTISITLSKDGLIQGASFNINNNFSNITVKQIAKSIYDTFEAKTQKAMGQYQNYQKVNSAIQNTFTGFIKCISEYNDQSDNGTQTVYITEKASAAEIRSTVFDAISYQIYDSGTLYNAYQADGQISKDEYSSKADLEFLRENLIFGNLYNTAFSINFDKSSSTFNMVGVGDVKNQVSIVVNPSNEVTNFTVSSSYNNETTIHSSVEVKKISEDEYNEAYAQIKANYDELIKLMESNKNEEME